MLGQLLLLRVRRLASMDAELARRSRIGPAAS
jgi:hypothetical protein